jgi:hypothetical protein
MAILDIGKYWGVFQDKKQWNGATVSKILEENLLQSALHQRLGEECTYEQDNNLQHKAKSTLELLTKKQWMFLSGQVTGIT